jgi:hypothetical protein
MKYTYKRLLWIVAGLLMWTVVGCPTSGTNSGPKGSPMESKNSPRCLLDPDPGPCKGLFEKYYYDRKAEKCRSFFYGGCEGTVPFETMAACRQACGGEK